MEPPISPSRVIHFRNVGPDMVQHDILSVAGICGAVEQILMLKAKNQALLQYVDLQSAISFMQYYSAVQLSIRGRNIYPQFSSHQELMSHTGVLNQHADNTMNLNVLDAAPNRILLVTINNAMYPITVDVLHQVFGPHGMVEKIVIFNKSRGLQALVQYNTVASATAAKDVLQGQNIYTNGSCQLHIQFSNLQQELTVNSNTEKTRDFTKPLLPPAPEPVHHHLPPQPQHHQPPPQQIPQRLMSHDPRYISPEYYAHAHQLGQYGVSPVSVGYPATQMNCVLLISNLNEEKINCSSLFNLFSNYGNVIRIKILHNKPDHALLQMSDYYQATTAIHYLKGVTIFDRQMDINFSKHTYITATANDPNDPTCADYSASSLNRFKKYPPGSEKASQAYKHMTGPGTLVHASNLSPTTPEETVQQLFSPFGTITGLKLFEYHSKKQALIQYKSVQSATEALATLHNTVVEGRNMKVSFSKNKL